VQPIGNIIPARNKAAIITAVKAIFVFTISSSVFNSHYNQDIILNNIV
jgi:hypothetical protein